MSSSSSWNWKVPASISWPISLSPATIFSRSAGAIRPAFSSAAECAIDPSISPRQSRQSKETDSEYFCTRRAVCSVKRPFHMAVFDSSELTLGGFALVNDQLVAVGILDHCHMADRRLDRL